MMRCGLFSRSPPGAWDDEKFQYRRVTLDSRPKFAHLHRQKWKMEPEHDGYDGFPKGISFPGADFQFHVSN